MDRFGLKKKLIPYHKFNEAKFLDQVLEKLESGMTLSLVSDAGTPCINDPGFRLVEACIKRDIPFTAIPGPCSLIVALVLSGFSTERFQCIGFLPKQAEKILGHSLFYPGTTLAFVSAEKLHSTLKILQKLSPERPLAIAREMTKTFEECKRGTAEELLSIKAKGEIVLLIGPSTAEPPEDPEECIRLLQQFHGLSLKDAIKLSAKLLKKPKREIYKKFQHR